MSTTTDEILRVQARLTDAIGEVKENERLAGLLRHVRLVLEVARREIEDKEKGEVTR
jgi:hypothetical protein